MNILICRILNGSVNYNGITYNDGDRLSVNDAEMNSAEFQSVRQNFRLLRREQALPKNMQSIIVTSESPVTIFDRPARISKKHGNKKPIITKEATHE